MTTTLRILSIDGGREYDGVEVQNIKEGLERMGARTTVRTYKYESTYQAHKTTFRVYIANQNGSAIDTLEAAADKLIGGGSMAHCEPKHWPHNNRCVVPTGPDRENTQLKFADYAKQAAPTGMPLLTSFNGRLVTIADALDDQDHSSIR